MTLRDGLIVLCSGLFIVMLCLALHSLWPVIGFIAFLLWPC